MDIKPIKTRRDHRAALKEIESLMSAEAATPEGDRLGVLVTLVEAYERTHFPMGLHTKFGIPAESLIRQGAGRATRPRGKTGLAQS